MNAASLNERITALEESLRAKDATLSLTRDADMAKYTTLHLGGPADLLACPDNPEQLPLLLQEAGRLDVPVLIMGNGSNLLVRDGGVRGMVIRLCRSMQRIEVEGNCIRAEAGAMLSSVAMAAAEANLSGLTWASGIPGTVGGGTYMNAGAYGGELAQVITLVEGCDLQGNPVCYTGEEMHFRHRYSRLMDEEKIITRVTFHLQPGKRENLLAEMADFNRRRAEKQPLSKFSAGSTFKRPVGGYASQMIDECGLKGVSVGGAQVSGKHAGFCINNGGTAADFLALMTHVQQVVQEKFGVLLEPEVQILGEDAPVHKI